MLPFSPSWATPRHSRGLGAPQGPVLALSMEGSTGSSSLDQRITNQAAGSIPGAGGSCCCGHISPLVLLPRWRFCCLEPKLLPPVCSGASTDLTEGILPSSQWGQQPLDLGLVEGAIWMSPAPTGSTHEGLHGRLWHHIPKTHWGFGGDTFPVFCVSPGVTPRSDCQGWLPKSQQSGRAGEACVFLPARIPHRWHSELELGTSHLSIKA